MICATTIVIHNCCFWLSLHINNTVPHFTGTSVFLEGGGKDLGVKNILYPLMGGADRNRATSNEVRVIKINLSIVANHTIILLIIFP